MVGLAETVFSLTTNKDLGVGFKEYDELIFAKDSSTISPFTDTQWNSIMKWYKIMGSIAGSLIIIAVIIVCYKMIIGSYSIEKRSEAKDSLMRLFFGVVCIIFAPIFVKLLLLINNNLVHMLLGYSNGNLNELIGNKILTNIETGNAIATAIVIAMFAYLFVKLNIKFIIRQFTIIIFTIFTPIVSIMWMINKRTIGASIWFGQIFINVFMQFIYAFLFLIYMQFLPQAGGWAVSLLWAMMILPLADVLQNTLQNLVSRIAGIDNNELANRGIGMAGAMAYSIKTIAYQFKNPEASNVGTSIFNKVFNRNDSTNSTEITPLKINELETTKMKTTNIDSNNLSNKVTSNNENVKSIGKKIINTGKEFMNIGMYMSDGKNFKTNNSFDKFTFNKSIKQREEKKSNNIKEDDKT